MQDELLAAYPVVYPQVVAWGDMDALGHVNSAIYHRYVESARIAYYSQIGLDLAHEASVVAQNSCRYMAPVMYPDTLHIGIRVEEIRRTAFRMTYALYSQNQQAIVATSEAVIVMMQSDMQAKQPISDELRNNIMTLESSVGNAPVTP